MEFLGYIRGERELVELSNDELIVLYFETKKETVNPSIEFIHDDVYLHKYKMSYIRQHQNQANRIIVILKDRGIKTYQIYLKYRYIKLKHLAL